MRKRKLYLWLAVLFAGILACTACGDKESVNEKETTKKTGEEKTTRKKPSKDEEETTVDLSKITYGNDAADEETKELLKTLLGENESADKIVYDLNFPLVYNKLMTSYYVLKGDAVNNKGKVNTELEESQEVVVSVDSNSNVKYFKFTVLSKNEAAPVKIDNIANNLLHNTDNVRGNITLKEKAGENNEIDIKWSCDRTDLVTITPTGEDGRIPAGVVTRGDKDETATLTATLTSGDYTTTKEFKLTIKAKPEEKEYSAYVYTYFRGNIYGNGESQHIHMATSEDGFYWTAINKNEPVLKAELGTKGVRDSYLVRSPEGDRFYLIGTDLDANGGDWGAYGGNGSRYIRIWESDDLINWSEERLILIAPENAACMWAPETTYDKTTGEYVVYWATGLKGGDGKKIWYAKTRDFYTFTEPQIYKDTDAGTTFIDTSMIEYQGTFYRFTKNENELSILLETSDAVLGDFSLVKTRIAGETGVEGPAIYKINGEEKWVLYMDGYTGKNSGVGYFPLIANSLEDLKTANFVRMEKGTYKMPEGAKHGSFVPITKEEYDALMAKWGN